eukprot:scaffold2734_cov350-Prasinococcus_capsulatus_cf.AAC.3
MGRRWLSLLRAADLDGVRSAKTRAVSVVSHPMLSYALLPDCRADGRRCAGTTTPQSLALRVTTLYPGGIFDPLGFAKYDETRLYDLKTKEIANGTFVGAASAFPQGTSCVQLVRLPARAAPQAPDPQCCQLVGITARQCPWH